MFYMKAMLFVFLVLPFHYVVKAQGNNLNPGKYQLAGSLNVLPNGDVNLSLNTKRQGAGPPLMPPSSRPTASTSGYTTGAQSGGTISTGTGSTISTTVPPSSTGTVPTFSTGTGPTISTGAGPTAGLSTPSGQGGGMGGSNPRQVGLNAHNEYRRVHSAPVMRLSSKLNDDAQRYASKLAHGSLFEHDSTNRAQGEQLGLQCAPGSDCDLLKKVVNAWYYEVCDYDFNNGKFSTPTGHFTQVVWKESTQLGIGYARGPYTFDGKKQYDNCLFVVGRYKDPGNVQMQGAFQKNVLKGSFNKQVSCPPPGNYGKGNELSKKSTAGHTTNLELVL